jgi:hypothetical protein
MQVAGSKEMGSQKRESPDGALLSCQLCRPLIVLIRQVAMAESQKCDISFNGSSHDKSRAISFAAIGFKIRPLPRAEAEAEAGQPDLIFITGSDHQRSNLSNY